MVHLEIKFIHVAIIFIVIIVAYINIKFRKRLNKSNKKGYKSIKNDEDVDIERLIIPSEDVNNELKKLLTEDRHLEAVKIYREATGTSLGEAKKYIDYLRGK